MKHLFFILLSVSLLSAPAISRGAEKIDVNPDIELQKIDSEFYIHTTWHDFPGFGRTPSNGLCFVKNGKVLLIDTPSTNEQTEVLYNYLKNALKAAVTRVVVGHSHADCMGGLPFLYEMGVESICGERTRRICEAENLPIPHTAFSEILEFEFEGEKVICRYFGAGHTVDNITVYFPASKILFGGCLIKSLSSNGLGNTQEAVIDDWDSTVMKLKEAYPETEIVIPGHGDFGDMSLLNHTMNLVNTFKKREMGK